MVQAPFIRLPYLTKGHLRYRSVVYIVDFSSLVGKADAEALVLRLKLPSCTPSEISGTEKFTPTLPVHKKLAGLTH